MWFQTKPRLFLRELRYIHNNLPQTQLYFSKKDTWCLKGKITIDEIDQAFLLEFPPTYPFSPPHIWPYKDMHFKEVADFRETTHQYTDDVLCLFTNDGGPGSWHFTMGLSDVMDKFRESVRLAQKKLHTDDHTSIINPLPGRHMSMEIYLPTEILDHLTQFPQTWGEIDLVSFADNRPIKLIFLDPQSEIMLGLLSKSPWNEYKLIEKKTNGIFVKLPFLMREFRQKLGTVNNLAEFLQAYNFPPVILINQHFLLLLFSDTKKFQEKVGTSQDFVSQIIYLYEIEGQNLSNINRIPLYPVHQISIPNDVFQRTLGTLDKLVDQIKQKKVLIIGIGTLGSTIALELAKTGIQMFILYDLDTLQPVNVCRHTGNILDVGCYKTDILREQILLRNPSAQVEAFHIDPFKCENILQFREFLKNVDITIDATANPVSNMLLNELAVDAKKPVIFGWCGYNATQGRIFRVIPFKTPCYNCVNVQLQQSPAIYPRIESPIKIDQNFQFEGYRQPGIPGISIDINFIALFIARFALQTIFGTQDILPNSYADHYIWNNRRSLIQPELDIGVTPFKFNRIPQCPICSLHSRSPKLDRKSAILIEKLGKELSADKRLEG
ncbi:MAG: putative ThiF family protein [Promethearchaeota archaeon CR_4]|nr:MAG: putative ThiF family protein [Candidatus Lokiarchaeota archaeon CR_4]